MWRTMRLALTALATVLVLAGPAAVPASAASSPVIADCVAHAKLTRTYTLKQLQQAQQQLSAETREYTDCADVIARALNAAISGHNTGPSGGGGSGSFLPTPVIVILVILILAGVSFGAVAIRRRSGGE
jgi:hypothetical protein